MKILSNKELEQEFKHQDFENEEICTWSVEDPQTMFADDNFNGTFEECLEYAKNKYNDNEFYQIALVRLDKNGCVIYCYDVKKFNNNEQEE